MTATEKRIAEISPAEIDKVVCDWTIDLRIALSEAQLNELVDRICARLGVLQ